MTTAGINGTISQMGIYAASNLLTGSPDVAKEIQEAKITTQYRTRTRDIKIVAKTKNIGKLEVIVQKNANGQYAVNQANYYDNMKNCYPIIP